MDNERIVYILEFLKRSSDDRRGVTVSEIQRYLAENANLRNVSPITIRRDIDRLSNMGHDIRRTAGAHNTSYYSLQGRGFSFNEIRFIVDSISMNKFLSIYQKQRLIKKFEGMCSDSQIRQLVSRISLNTNVKPSLDLLDNLDKIHKLIAEHRRIDFRYGRFNTQKQMIYYDKRRQMLPIRVVYFNERFYLRCFNEQNSEFRTYRIDRMNNIRGGQVTRVKPPDDKKYDGFVADMFPAERFDTVTFRVKRYLLDEMLEQFGEIASVRDDFDDPGNVIIRVKCGINRQFCLWVLHYGEGIEIVSPDIVRDAFADIVKNIMKLYSDI